MKNLKDIKPFAIDCSSLCEDDVEMTIDKMISVGIDAYDNTSITKWNDYPFWGFNGGFGTYTGEIHYWERNPMLITPDQLDEHLGLTPESNHEMLDLRNTKIDLRKEDGTVDEELSRAFQEAVFEQGGKWGDGTTRVNSTNKDFLYVSYNLILTYGTLIDTYNSDKNKQITFSYERKLEWKAEFVEEVIEKQIIELPNGDKYFAEDLQEALSKIKKIEE